MKTWPTSLNGAVTLSALAMLSIIGYAFLESRYFLGEWTPRVAAAAVETSIVLILVGLWLWAIFAARDGKRSGLIVALTVNALVAVIALYDLLLYSPILFGWPLVQIMVVVLFIIGVIATAALAAQLRKNRAAG
ncbi:MAG: hypothetical protein ACE5GO_11800 [Anaerolineales bacterium]